MNCKTVAITACEGYDGMLVGSIKLDELALAQIARVAETGRSMMLHTVIKVDNGVPAVVCMTIGNVPDERRRDD